MASSTRGERGRAYHQGDHICAVYKTPEEQLADAVDYVADGLSRNERCLYAADEPESLDLFCDALARAGVDARAAERDGRLLLLTKETAHLRGGRFDSESMLHMLSEAVEDALNDGYRGLRTCGDMSWLLDGAPGSEQVVEYEALLNQFFASVRAMGMCQYDVARVPEGLLDHALDTHSSVVVSGTHRQNPYYRRSSAAAPTAHSRPIALRDKLADLNAL